MPLRLAAQGRCLTGSLTVGPAGCLLEHWCPTLTYSPASSLSRHLTQLFVDLLYCKHFIAYVYRPPPICPLKRKSDLFDLVQSLTRQEKRYFTLRANASSGKNKQYQELYEAILKQTVYDEQALRATFGSRLPPLKQSLYDNLLGALREFRANNSRSVKMKQQIEEAQLLYEKKLYDQCSVRLTSAKRIAEELNNCLALLEINLEERRLANTRIGDEVDDTSLTELLAGKDEIFQCLSHELALLDLHDTLIRMVRIEQKIDEVTRLSAEKLLQVEPEHGLRAKLRFFQCRALLAKSFSDWQTCYENYYACHQIWLAHPLYREEELNRYLNDSFNLASIMLQVRDHHGEILQLLDELKAVKPRNDHEQRVYFERYINLRIQFSVNVQPPESSADLLGEVRNALTKQATHTISGATLQMNTAIFVLMREEWQKAREWLQGVLDNKAHLPEEYLLTAKLLLLLVEVNDDSDAAEPEQELLSTNRFLKNRQGRLAELCREAYELLRQFHKLPVLEGRQVLRDKQDTFATRVAEDIIGLGEILSIWIDARLGERMISEQVAYDERRRG